MSSYTSSHRATRSNAAPIGDTSTRRSDAPVKIGRRYRACGQTSNRLGQRLCRYAVLQGHRDRSCHIPQRLRTVPAQIPDHAKLRGHYRLMPAEGLARAASGDDDRAVLSQRDHLGAVQ